MILERLEEIRVKKTCNKEKCDTKEICRICVVDDAIEIVKQVAEEFATDTNVGSNGWIPCSESLPEESLNSVIGWDEYRQRCCFVQYYGGRWILGNDIDSVKIIAWKPLPERFKESD